jgi:hypothetical protein
MAMRYCASTLQGWELFQRNYDTDFSNPMQSSYQWQVTQHIQAPVDIGLQVFCEFGQWNHFPPEVQQSHRIGPAIFGKIDLGDDKLIAYNVAVLFDILDDTRANTVGFQAMLNF